MVTDYNYYMKFDQNYIRNYQNVTMSRVFPDLHTHLSFYCSLFRDQYLLFFYFPTLCSSGENAYQSKKPGMCLVFSAEYTANTPCIYSLCGFKGHLKVLSAIARTEGGVVESIWEEVMHQSAEGHPVTPAGGEVLNFHVLT